MENLKETLQKLETELITQSVRSSADKLNKLLSDDFLEYGSSGGIYDKKITLNSLTNEPSLTYKIYDFEIMPFSDDFIQTRFKTDRINLDGTILRSLRSSIWRKCNDKW